MELSSQICLPSTGSTFSCCICTVLIRACSFLIHSDKTKTCISLESLRISRLGAKLLFSPIKVINLIRYQKNGSNFPLCFYRSCFVFNLCAQISLIFLATVAVAEH